MTRIRHDTDLVQAILDIRRAGELLAHTCHCDGKVHTLGQHLWNATKDMRPGIRASAPGSQTAGSGDTQPSAEPTDPHDAYRDLLERIQTTALDLAGFIAHHRPDRKLAVVRVPLDTDDQWCRSCLAAGYFHPRFRNEGLCQWCLVLNLTYKIDPPPDIVRAHHEVRKLSQTEVAASMKAERKRLNAEKRKKQTA